jgi:hypothetical protein
LFLTIGGPHDQAYFFNPFACDGSCRHVCTGSNI